jgi:hypothetical protein
MKTNFFVKHFDLYGTGFKLNISGEEKVKTWVGSIFGLVTLFTTFTLCLLLLTDLFQHNVKFLIHSEIRTIPPINNLSEIPMMFSLVDVSGNIIPNEKLYSFEVIYTSYISENNNFNISALKNNNFHFKLEKCEKQIHLGKYANLFEKINLQNFFCIPQGKFNLTLFGTYGDLINGFSSINIKIKKCDKTKEECFDETIVENKLTNSSLVYLTLGYQIDHFNFTIPYEPILQSFQFPITPSNFIKKWIHHITPVVYVSDIGFFRVLKEKVKFFNHQSTTLDLDTSQEKNLENENLNLEISSLSIRNSHFTSHYKRHSFRLFDFIAKIGGVVNFLMIIFQFFSLIFTHNIVIEKISKIIFNFEENFEGSRESSNVRNMKGTLDKFSLPSKNLVPTVAGLGRYKIIL